MPFSFTPRAQSALRFAQEETKRFGVRAVGTEHILLGLLNEPEGIAHQVLTQLGINIYQVREEIEVMMTGIRPNSEYVVNDLPYTPRARQVLVFAADEAKRMNVDEIGTEHLLLGLLRDDLIISSRILRNLGVAISRVRQLIAEKLGMDLQKSERKVRKKNARATASRPTAQQSSESATPTLDQMGRDLTELAREGKLDPIIGREKETRRIIQILSRRTKNNPVLVGEPGVGKTAIAEGLAQLIVSGGVPETIVGKRLMALDMATLVAGTKYRGEFEQRMKDIIDEIYEDGEVILFIDELHTLIGAGGAEGAIDASNILKPALARGELQTIGATTFDEYQKYIEKDAALERRFGAVIVDPPTEEETLAILKGLREKYEQHHQVTLTDEALSTAVKLSTRYMSDRMQPDKAIDLMDESAAKVAIDSLQRHHPLVGLKQKLATIEMDKEKAIRSQNFEKASQLRHLEIETKADIQALEEKREAKARPKVTDRDVAEVVGQLTGIPTQQLKEEESERLMRLESILHERVIGQDEAVQVVSRAIRRARSGLKDPKKPIGSFLFLGPTGVGKTELAKTIAEVLFRSEDALVRIDMSEYMDKFTTSRLVGSPPGYVGYDEGGQLTEQIRQKPYSVILLDEVEKAHPDVFNMLLQVLDDGQLTDGKGRRVDFKNTIIIMSSNLGATALCDEKSVGFQARDVHQDHDAMEKRIREELKQYFRPEFLNRIDETVVFHSLNKENLREIVKLLSADVIKRAEELGIDLRITNAAMDVIATKGYQPEYGARPLQRTIQQEFEDLLSEAILSGTIIPGDAITIGATGGKIILRHRMSQKASKS
ncbi:ATP-dependent Clp protease ATP-binding subunit [Allofustis seminis]|uniref:ATP-dependent Clp protease ATP-binding subunit n=1 Tax=Allofustis seminis TaxID=166939 RepID=UPI0003762260|nr:ATP-dependent Clp protease ATP-binding subunit [Allofustis seminis]